jgi:hypothetical protein
MFSKPAGTIHRVPIWLDWVKLEFEGARDVDPPDSSLARPSRLSINMAARAGPTISALESHRRGITFMLERHCGQEAVRRKPDLPD